MKNFKLAVLASTLVASGSVMAATQGSLGLDSTGTSIVTIIKQNAVQITDVDDLDLGNHATLAGPASDSDDVCIFNSTGNYRVTVTSNNGSFNLTSGGNLIPYTFEWAANGNPAAAVTYNTAVTGLTGDSSSLTCAGSGGTNASFGVTVAAADFNAAAPGTYTDTVTLFVEPE